jgi:hypothetical protein
MAKIPPKAFSKLSQEEQITYATKEMQKYQDLRDRWHKIMTIARRHRMIESDPDRPDEALLKGN